MTPVGEPIGWETNKMFPSIFQTEIFAIMWESQAMSSLAIDRR